jgi:cytochrome c oxidase subunit 2
MIWVFGAMAYAMFKFRKSKGAVAAQFSHNTLAEVIWTVIPDPDPDRRWRSRPPRP